MSSITIDETSAYETSADETSADETSVNANADETNANSGKTNVDLLGEMDTRSEIYNRITNERNNCSRILEDLLKDCKIAIIKLDKYYEDLQWYNTLIQTSVIVFSSGSTFMQSLFKEGNEDITHIVTLCVSTYSTLTLSLSKFFRLDEKREKAGNLSEKFIELQSRIRYHYDLLEPWRDDKYYDNQSEVAFFQLWAALKVEIDNSHKNILEIKKNLFIDYDKIIINKKERNTILYANHEINMKKLHDEFGLKLSNY